MNCRRCPAQMLAECFPAASHTLQLCYWLVAPPAPNPTSAQFCIPSNNVTRHSLHSYTFAANISQSLCSTNVSVLDDATIRIRQFISTFRRSFLMTSTQSADKIHLFESVLI
jgi:hypothetical protein